MKDPKIITLNITGVKGGLIIQASYPFLVRDDKLISPIGRFVKFFERMKILDPNFIQDLIFEISDVGSQDSKVFTFDEDIEFDYRQQTELNLKFKLRSKIEFHIQYTKIVTDLKQDIQQLNQYVELLKKRFDKEKVQVKSELDLLILYSDPLIKVKKNTNLQLPVTRLNHYQEIQLILESIESSGSRFTYQIDQATIENFSLYLYKQPKVIHIISHGDYDKEKAEYYLCFEKNGMQDQFYANELCQMLSQMKKGLPKLILLSSCHSGNIADRISKQNVDYSIGVSQEYKIEDGASHRYVSRFYQKLFQNESVLQAHENTKNEFKNSQAESQHTCCCAHNHLPNCQFDKGRANESDGFQKYHNFHTPINAYDGAECYCKDTERNVLLHSHTCKWAEEFYKTVFQSDDWIEIQDKLEPHLVKNQQKTHYKICCCEITNAIFQGDEKKINMNHDETQKFEVYGKLENDTGLFELKERGDFVVENNISKQSLIGRGVEQILICEYLKAIPTEYFILYGVKGIGKTDLAKQSIQYMEVIIYHNIFFLNQERKKIKFSRRKQIDMFDCKKIKYPQLLEQIKIQYGAKSIQEFKNYLIENKGMGMVLLFDDCEDLFESQDDFLKLINSIVDIQVHVILTLKQKPTFQGKYRSRELLPLNKQFAIDLFISNRKKKNILLEEVNTFDNDKKCDKFRIPSNILRLAQTEEVISFRNQRKQILESN